LKTWQTEQKLTVVLLVLTFLSCHPWAVYDLYRPTETSNQLILVSETVIKAFTLFFLFVVFGSFRYRHPDPSRGFFLGKFVVAVMVWVLSIAAIKHQDVRIPAQFVGAGVTVWLLGSVCRAWLMLDPVDGYKFRVYTAATMGLTIAHELGLVVPSMGAAACFAMQFGGQNVFALMMTYWHWPFDVTADQTYDQSGENEGKELIVEDSE
jgi:hypothetical protein